VPTYLIPVGYKVSIKEVESEYSKGIWMIALQLGLSLKIFNSKRE
jgi:hypothetical protein